MLCRALSIRKGISSFCQAILLYQELRVKHGTIFRSLRLTLISRD